ncbi:MAG: ATP-binding cassette domain-containing protein [Phycisphaeraceae bacterium]|nr:ATP-binding cassette domain-containing protein [Phycisphaeraceae bacterium]
MPQNNPTTDTIIKCADLTKVFKDFWLRNRVVAVDHIDLEVNRGEVFGLLGPNGSGKSTTIKMILGLLHPTSGRIAVFGRHPREVSIKQDIGYLPEESYLYQFLNAQETLEYYGRLFHQNRAQRRRRIEQLLHWVGLEHVARRPVGEYSKGMARRIGLAQALINDPQLLILDEPTSGLDPIGTRQIKDLISELAQRGKTVLLCSHLLADVEDVCHRVAIMFGGKVRKEGTVDQLLVRQDMTTIQTSTLEPAVVQEIEQVLARHGRAIERVDSPRQKLEQLFLDIVHQAQSEGATFSGARSGGKLAEFLTASAAHMPEDVSAQELIDQLTTPAGSKARQRPLPGSPAHGRPDSQSPARTEPGSVNPVPAPGKQQPPAAEPDLDANLEQLDRLMAEMGVSQKKPDARTTIERELAHQPPEEVVRSDQVELPDWAKSPRSESEQPHKQEQVDRSLLDSLLKSDKEKRKDKGE